MHRPAAPIFPILDKSRLFVHLPTDLQNQNGRYLHCPATEHFYCMSTGSLYWRMPIIPLSANTPSLRQRNDSCLPPSIPTPYTIKTVSVDRNNIDQQDNGASPTLSTESNISPKGKDADEYVQGNNAPIPRRKVVLNVKNTDQHMQGNGASAILNTQSNKTPGVKYGHKSIQGNGASKTPNTTSKVNYNRASNVNNVQGIGASTISKTTPKVKHASRAIRGNSPSIISNVQRKKNVKVKKKAVQPIQGITSSPQANSPVQSTNNFSTCLQSNSSRFTKKKKKKRSKKSKDGSKKKLCKVIVPPQPHVYKNSWSFLRPFNRRPHPNRDRKKSLLSSQCKNCIMASFVHEIIHSQFAKNTDEHMPESQIRAMLSSGDRKLKARDEWIQRMEEEAIHKYKKIYFEKYKQRLVVQEYDVLHHKEKFWLACSSRSVKNRKTKESWPLLVKCLHKYPDSTLRQACTHRSFCLRWNGMSYTLRMDHAYYTQIQCHMAITNTTYAELIVHTHKETTFLPVYFDVDFWEQTEESLETFFTSNILPYLKKNEIESNPVSAPFDSENSNDVIIEE